jgi:hypothetical protein
MTVNMSDPEKILFGFVLGIIGTTFGSMLNHFFSNKRRRQEIYSKAVIAFKSAFSPEIAAISKNLYAMDTFPIAFSRHESAVDNIRPILPERYQRKLQEAWNEYCGKDNGVGMESKEFIAACNASLYSTDQELFKSLKKHFQDLHGCLDKLL